jgi:hypothetical protein
VAKIWIAAAQSSPFNEMQNFLDHIFFLLMGPQAVLAMPILRVELLTDDDRG